MTRPVFVSYSNKDRAMIPLLAADLAAIGVKVW
jgi:hypothetical protein